MNPLSTVEKKKEEAHLAKCEVWGWICNALKAYGSKSVWTRKQLKKCVILKKCSDSRQSQIWPPCLIQSPVEDAVGMVTCSEVPQWDSNQSYSVLKSVSLSTRPGMGTPNHAGPVWVQVFGMTI